MTAQLEQQAHGWSRSERGPGIRAVEKVSAWRRRRKAAGDRAADADLRASPE